jgi:hypothetical protein
MKLLRISSMQPTKWKTVVYKMMGKEGTVSGMALRKHFSDLAGVISRYET